MSDPNTNAPDPQPEPAAAPEVHPPSDPAANRPEAFSWQRGADAAAGAQPASQPPAPATPTRAAGARSDASAPRLSTFLKVSIVLLAGLTIASISLLFIGDFEGKFERVFSTFALFAVFVLFTALDTRRGQKSEWYAPVALIANAYILGLLLIVIWMTPYDTFSLMWEIFWKSVFVILVTRLVILCCQLLLHLGSTAVVTRFAFVTSVLAVLSGILFTAPVGIEAFDLYIPDLYWKIATALLILTALGLSITLLLRWSYGADAREAARAAKAGAPQPAQQQPPQTQQPPQPQTQQQPQPQTQQQPQPQQQTQQTQQPQQTQQTQQQAPPLLPWPTFSDGRPLPARADGQPDFSVLGHGQPDAPR
ncbi:hypothetical protein [Leucobacter triazinivorans]|uniref:Uncharacterized protein n=1 Tax=Leucobacter triazinivorans TaxID=1784719 RepID=A0A4P6KDX3_9MICO|nr:hypothetical protein [Leucobacter triazinivorans]QBE48586.1 hypothetical protein EVS81_06865 [Leucobacter triazinivorans]